MGQQNFRKNLLILVIWVLSLTFIYKIFNELKQSIQEPFITRIIHSNFKCIGASTLKFEWPLVEYGYIAPNLVGNHLLTFHLEIPKKYPVELVPPCNGLPNNIQPTNINQEVRLLTYHDAIFSSDSIIYCDNTFYTISYSCHPRFWPNLFNQTYFHMTQFPYFLFESAICVGHQHSSDFGHWFLEVFPALCALPWTILSSSNIILPRNDSHVFNGLKFLNLKNDQMLFGENRFFFAHSFYTTSMSNCGDLNQNLIINFRKIFCKRFNLDKEKPTHYILFNRPNMSRCIKNYEEIFEMLRKTWPQFKWEDGLHLFQLQEQAAYFNTIKLVFTIHGSLLANTVFMQPGTIVCDLQMAQVLLSFMWVSNYCGLHYVFSRDEKISWRGLEPNTIDLNQVHNMIKSGLVLLNAINPN